MSENNEDDSDGEAHDGTDEETGCKLYKKERDEPVNERWVKQSMLQLVNERWIEPMRV